MVKFNAHHITDGTTKARVHYCLDNRIDGLKCVTVYHKDYSGALGHLAAVLNASYTNNTDIVTDYFEKGKLVIFEMHPEYSAIRARVESLLAIEKAKNAARMAKWAAVSQEGR